MGEEGEGHEGQGTRHAKAKELASAQARGDTGNSLWPKHVLLEKEAGES